MDHHRWTLGKMQNPVRGFLHGGAALVAVVGTIFLVVRGSGTVAKLALAVFGLGMVGLFATSSLYHSIPWGEIWKRRMQRLDHSMILVLVAATYTPMAVIVFDGPLEWGVLAMAWGLTVIGIGQHAFFPFDSMVFSVVLQVTLGWLAIFIMWPFAQRVGWAAVMLAGLGGIFYTLGMVILVTRRPRLWPRVFSHHEVFHVFTIVAGAMHWVMTYRYVAPLPA